LMVLQEKLPSLNGKYPANWNNWKNKMS